MRRISRGQLEMEISIALSVLKPYQKRAIGLAEPAAYRDVVADLLRRIMGPPESEAVILKPSLVGAIDSPRHGRWGEDEPHPYPDVPFER